MDYDGDKGIDDASQASGLGDDVESMGGKLGEKWVFWVYSEDAEGL